MSERKRPVRVASCSGAASDPGQHMYNQAYHGNVDVITGDYLAEVNLATTAVQVAECNHPGWIPTAEEGLSMTLEIAQQKGIKIIINGGGLNPKGLALKTLQMAQDRGLNTKVAWVDGDDVMPQIDKILHELENGDLKHLDGENEAIQYKDDTDSFLRNRDTMPVLSANAYLGYRAIRQGLEAGADVIICGRVADASPVIAAAAWWHGWDASDFDALAGSLIAGHLIECSTYGSGANFAGFDHYKIEDLLDLGLPIAEIDYKGETVITKAEGLNGIITADTVRCQLVYELQGDIYLNSDVKADISDISVVDLSNNRVRVSGAKGNPPPPTTKLAVFYRGGYQCEMTINACGYATDRKWELQEAQIKHRLQQWGVLDQFSVLEFQRVGIPQANPRTQLSSTTYFRLFAQARDKKLIRQLGEAYRYDAMAHFPGMHGSLDKRTLVPAPFLAYYPVTLPQSYLDEGVEILGPTPHRIAVGPPKQTEPLGPRNTYETSDPRELQDFGPTVMRPLGDLVLARSGDKGANVNIGLFVHTAEEWGWLRAFMTRDQMQLLIGDDWQDWFFIERVEFPNIYAVHFVVYGLLGRGFMFHYRNDSYLFSSNVVKYKVVLAGAGRRVRRGASEVETIED